MKKKQTAKTMEAVAKCVVIYNNSTHIFTASLKLKSKNDLIDILTTLELEMNGTKEVLSEQIETYFQYHPANKESNCFCGLFNPTWCGACCAVAAALPDGTENIQPTITHPSPTHGSLPPTFQPVASPSHPQLHAYAPEQCYHPYQLLSGAHPPLHHSNTFAPSHPQLQTYPTDPQYNHYSAPPLSSYTQPKLILVGCSYIKYTLVCL
jgi:hypothetical protein